MKEKRYFSRLFTKTIKCNCGHVNPVDAKFCERCTNLLKNYDAFISYRRESGSVLASLIMDKLESKYKKKIFLDVKELQVGRFDEKLLNVIEDTPHFILILSPGSLDRCVNRGDWLKREIMHAIKTRRNIIPIMTEGFTFPDQNKWSLLPAEMQILNNYHAVPYSHNFQEESIQRIPEFMRVVVKPFVSPPPEPEKQTPEPVKEIPEPAKEIPETVHIPEVPNVQIGSIEVQVNEDKKEVFLGNIDVVQVSGTSSIGQKESFIGEIRVQKIS